MDGKILIVEDEFIIASSLKIILEGAGHQVQGIAMSVSKALDMINAEKPSWVFLDIFLTGRLTGIDLARKLMNMHIPFIYVSANSSQDILREARATKPYGFLVKPFKEQDVLVTLDVARYRYDNDLETQLQSETALMREVVRIFAGTMNKEEEVCGILNALRSHIPFDSFVISWKDKYGQPVAGHIFIGENTGFEKKDLKELFAGIPVLKKDLSWLRKSTSPSFKARLLTDTEFDEPGGEYAAHSHISRKFNLHTALTKSLVISGWGQLSFTLYTRGKNGFKQQHSALLDRLELLLVKIADYFPQIKKLGPVAPPGKVTGSGQSVAATGIGAPDPNLSPTPLIDYGSYGMIGSAAAFEKVKEQMAIVAPFDISVLILGESGTGKESIAQAIHYLSERRSKPLIKVNCSAIPATLIESELFGHEKGAFTGAIDRRIGKFEEAHGGTIFLDEIGEVPLDVQVKLLNVLQEREIVRLGGNNVIKTDVRIIAATNRNLEKAISEGKFRLDLYYRLNVFPIVVPPLRTRKEDIPALATHFTKKLSARMGKPSKDISGVALSALLYYDWPGNIRELENIIERSFILSKGQVIEQVELPDVENIAPVTAGSDTRIKTIRQLEKEHILTTLEFCKGRISGPGGAAELLDISPNTLVNRLKKLGITKDVY